MARITRGTSVMPFLLAKGEPAIATEVQRWQHFLRRMGVIEVGGVDGRFGTATERATRTFQNRMGVPATGRLDAACHEAALAHGYVAVPDTHYDRDPARKPAASMLKSPNAAWRAENLGCYVFEKPRTDDEDIVIRGDCSGTPADWTEARIMAVPIPQLVGIPGASSSGMIEAHLEAAPRITALFRAWEKAGLMHLVLSWAGCFVPRYRRPKKDEKPIAAHGRKDSSGVGDLSNHAFGSAFDINVSANGFDRPPAAMGARGCVRELVPIANELGFFWGGHFSTPDGMHFELARL